MKNKTIYQRHHINKYDFTSLYPHLVSSDINDYLLKKIKRTQRKQKIKEIFDEEERIV